MSTDGPALRIRQLGAGTLRAVARPWKTGLLLIAVALAGGVFAVNAFAAGHLALLNVLAALGAVFAFGSLGAHLLTLSDSIQIDAQRVELRRTRWLLGGRRQAPREAVRRIRIARGPGVGASHPLYRVEVVLDSGGLPESVTLWSGFREGRARELACRIADQLAIPFDDVLARPLRRNPHLTPQPTRGKERSTARQQVSVVFGPFGPELRFASRFSPWTEGVRVGVGRVEREVRLFGVRVTQSCISTAGLEKLCLATEADRPVGVLLESGGARLICGTGLDSEAREWVRAWIQERVGG